MSRNNDYTTCNLLDFAYFLKNYRLVSVDLSKQPKLKYPQKANFIGKLTWRTNLWSNNVFHHWQIRGSYFWVFAKFCKHLIKMETQKIVNLSDISQNEYSKLATKTKWYFIDGETKGTYLHPNPIKFLISSLEWSICDYSDAYILVTGNIAVIGANNYTKVAFKIVHHLENIKQKSMILLLIRQSMLILQCLCIIWLNTVIIILILYKAYGALKEIK